MTISVRSEAPDGTDGIWIDTLGEVSRWRHTVTCPGGDSSAQWSFHADALLNHRALLPGRLITAYASSTPVWTGRLEEPDHLQQPWAMSAVGRAYLAKDHIVTSGASPITMDTAVADAISHGLPWTLPAGSTLADPAANKIAQYSTLDDALGLLTTDDVAWVLSQHGQISTVSLQELRNEPPTLLLHVSDLPARSLDGYANTVILLYKAAGGGNSSLTTVTASTAELALRGRVEVFRDLTDSQAFTASQIAALGANLVAQLSQPVWQAPFPAAAAGLSTLRGGRVDPATVRPGVVVRILSLHVDGFGTSSADIPIGQVDYDDESGNANLTAMANAKDTLAELIARVRRI